jgi:hypothetical protein
MATSNLPIKDRVSYNGLEFLVRPILKVGEDF